MLEQGCNLPYELIFDIQDILLEKFAQKQPSCVAYDEKMQVYKTVDCEVASLPSTREVEFALLRMEPLARALQENARCWVTSIGKLLNDAAKESLLQLKNELSVSVPTPGDCPACLFDHICTTCRVCPKI